MFLDTLGMRLRAAYLTFHRRANAHFEPFGMTADQFVVLSIVAEERGLTQREIVERASSDPNTIGAILLKLEDKGLVRRDDHPRDRRAYCVQVTDQGRKVYRQRTTGSQSLREELDALFTPKERYLLAAWLARIPPAMDAARRGPSEDVA